MSHLLIAVQNQYGRELLFLKSEEGASASNVSFSLVEGAGDHATITLATSLVQKSTEVPFAPGDLLTAYAWNADDKLAPPVTIEGYAYPEDGGDEDDDLATEGDPEDWGMDDDPAVIEGEVIDPEPETPEAAPEQ